MINTEWAFVAAVIAGVLDVGANLASTSSRGFTKYGWGALSIVLVLVAFAFLAEAAKGIDLAIAYAILGTTGIFGTALCGRVLYGKRLKPIAWLGFACVLAAMILLHSSRH